MPWPTSTPAAPARSSSQANAVPTSRSLHVRDNGRGIAAEDIPKVFEPFRRVGRQDVPGEGMGLAYVQMLVRRHGGDIRCHSTLGVGTTFTFTIAPPARRRRGACRLSSR